MIKQVNKLGICKQPCFYDLSLQCHNFVRIDLWVSTFQFESWTLKGAFESLGYPLKFTLFLCIVRHVKFRKLWPKPGLSQEFIHLKTFGKINYNNRLMINRTILYLMTRLVFASRRWDGVLNFELCQMQCLMVHLLYIWQLNKYGVRQTRSQFLRTFSIFDQSNCP